MVCGVNGNLQGPSNDVVRHVDKRLLVSGHADLEELDVVFLHELQVFIGVDFRNKHENALELEPLEIFKVLGPRERRPVYLAHHN